MINPEQSEETRIAGIIGFANKYKLSANQLEKLINAPAMNKENILLYMSACTPEELAQLFYQTGLIKLMEMVDKNQQLQLKAQNELITPLSPAPPGDSSEAISNSK